MNRLRFEGRGVLLEYCVLEAGTLEAFKNFDESSRLAIDAGELSMMSSGISLRATSRRRKRFAKPNVEYAAWLRSAPFFDLGHRFERSLEKGYVPFFRAGQ